MVIGGGDTYRGTSASALSGSMQAVRLESAIAAISEARGYITSPNTARRVSSPNAATNSPRYLTDAVPQNNKEEYGEDAAALAKSAIGSASGPSICSGLPLETAYRPV